MGAGVVGHGGGAGLPSAAGGGAGFGFEGAIGNNAIGVGAGAAIVLGGAAYAVATASAEAGLTHGAAVAGTLGGPVGIAAVVVAVAAVTAIVQEVLDAFGIDLFGGGASRPTPPPMDYRFGHYPPGPFIGVLPALVPDMQDSAAVEAAAMFSSPVAVSSSAPPSMSGDPSGGHLSMAQYITSSSSASPNPQIKKSPPVPTPAPTPYPQCIARYFAGANAKYAELPGACVAGGISCLLTGLPIACIPGYAACLGGIFIEAKCYKQSKGNQ